MMKILPQLHLTLSKETETEIVTPEFGSPIVKIKKEMRDEESSTEEEDNVREQTPARNQGKESQGLTKKKEVKRERVDDNDEEEEVNGV